MAFNRDLSQLANFLEVNSDGTFVNIIPSTSQAQLGIGTNNPTAKLDVLGNARVSGNLSATNINASGIVTATSGFVGALTGLASSATQLATGRTVAITGDLAYTSESFNGTGNVTGVGTLANTAVTPGSYGSSTEVATFTVDSKGRLTAAGTASVGTALTVAGDSGSENISLLSEVLTISGGTNLNSSAASNTLTVNLDPNISLTSVVASGIVTAAQFVTGASGSAIGISTNTISGPATITIDPAAVGDNTGLVVIKGDLQIDGTTTTINSTTVTIDDKNIQIADGAANDAAADGAGFTIVSGDGNKTFQFQDTGDNLGSSENLNIASGKVYKVNNTEVLSSTTLGSGVVNSSLTSVGTLTNLSVGNINSSGIVTATSLIATNINASGIVTTSSLRGYSALVGTASSTTTTFIVTVASKTSNHRYFGTGSGNAYFIDGIESPFLTLLPGKTYRFNQESNTNGSHPILFYYQADKTTGYTTNVTTTGTPGSAGAYTEIVVTDTTPVVLHYQCSAHGYMGNAAQLNSNVVDTPYQITARSGINVTGVTTSSSGFVGALTGLASSATQLATGRTVAITGDLAYTSGSFDGTSNVTGTGTLATVNSNVGSFGSQTLIPVVTVNAKGLVTAVTTAAVGTALTVSGDSGSENIDLLSETLTISGGTNLTSSAASNAVTVNLDPNISLTSVVASGIVTAAQFVTGASGSAIGINTNTISGPETITIDPAGVGDNTGAVRIKGDLFVDGTQFIVNSTTIELADFVVGIASTATTDILADGAGIKIGPDNTLTYDHTNTALKSSENFNLASGKTYKINGTDVLSSTTLGSAVVNSSLTSIGTLTNLSVGNVNSSGIITATSGFVGNLTGNINSSGVSTVTNLNIGGYVSIGNTIGVAAQVIASTGVGVTWKTFADLLPQTRTGLTTSATASQTLFSFVYNVNFLDVFVNGVKLSSGEFTASNGTTITLSEGAFANDTVEFVSYNTVGAGSGQVSSLNDLTDVTLTGTTTGQLLAYNGSEFVNTSNINVTGIITATSFVGDGSGLTGAGSTVFNNTTTNQEFFPLFTSTTSGTITASGISTSKLKYNPSTGTVTATSFVGDGSGLTGAGSTVFNNTTTNQEFFPLFTSTTSGTITASGISTSKLKYNPSTGTVTATSFVGNGSALTGLTANSVGALAGFTVKEEGSTVGAAGSVGSIDFVSINLTATASGVGATITLSDTPSFISVVASGIVTAAQFVTGASGVAIGINTNTISGPATITIDPAAVGDNTGLVVIKGDLQIDGTTTTVNSTTMTVDDINITLASGAANSAAANGAGITIDGASATLLYASTGDKWVFNKDVEAVDFNSTSDINLKENIRQVESASELVSKLEGVHFSWKETGKETIGVIAQQIEEHLPQLVQTGDTHKTVNYNGLIGVLIEAVKEQGAQIAALQAEIEELKK